MTRRTKRDTSLCRTMCVYFKPGKNEEMMCQGFVVVQNIKRRGKDLSLSRPRGSASASTLEGLRKRVCAVCSFQPSDCDFILTGGTATPCGGLSLLSHLLERGEITLAEIEESE